MSPNIWSRVRSSRLKEQVLDHADAHRLRSSVYIITLCDLAACACSARIRVAPAKGDLAGFD